MLPLPTLISTVNSGEQKRVEDMPDSVRKIWKEAVERVLYAMQDDFAV